MTKLILIVEDGQNQRKVLKFALNRLGFDIEAVSGEDEALKLLSCNRVRRFDLVLLDMMIGEISGRNVLNLFKEARPDLPVIVLTGQDNVDHAAENMGGSAIDVISIPVEMDRLKASLENAFRMSDGSCLRRNCSGQLGFGDLIGSSEVMTQAVELARKATHSNIPILLEGESGVGKEVFARAIRGESDRNGRPFVVVNCGAIPGNLVESILFGHEKGAFTGAMGKHAGKFVEADGGTLFLDEIGELPLELQVKLLRVLQEGEVDPVGSRRSVQVDVRLISATNRRLRDMVRNGAFREDLFYRLHIFPIKLPPLRDRKSDIEQLVPHFIENISISAGCPLKEITPDAMTLLKSYNWPGNVRQLENAMFRAAILSEGEAITAADFPQIHSKIRRQSVLSNLTGMQENSDAPEITHNNVALTENMLSGLDENGDIRRIRDVERDMISFAMKKYEGRMSEVAHRLGLGRSTLYRKVSEHGPKEEAP